MINLKPKKPEYLVVESILFKDLCTDIIESNDINLRNKMLNVLKTVHIVVNKRRYIRKIVK